MFPMEKSNFTKLGFLNNLPSKKFRKILRHISHVKFRPKVRVLREIFESFLRKIFYNKSFVKFREQIREPKFLKDFFKNVGCVSSTHR